MPTHSVTHYPNTITQHIPGDGTSAFQNLANLKNGSNTYAKTKKLTAKTGKSPRIPQLICSNFKFNIPNAAEITSIRVEFAHQKLDDVQNRYPSIGASTITLIDKGTEELVVSRNASTTGSTPTATMAAKTKTFNGKYTAQKLTGGTVIDENAVKDGVLITRVPKMKTVTLKYSLPKPSVVNDADFAVKINYPQNVSKKYGGYLQLKYVRITVNYKTPTYTLQLAAEGDYDNLIGDTLPYVVVMNNPQLMSYKPKVTISVTGGTIDTRDTRSSLVKGDSQITYKPLFNKANGTDTFDFTMVYDSETPVTITVTENYSNVTSTLVVTPVPRPTGIIESTDIIDGDNLIYGKTNTDFIIPVQIPKNFLEDSSISNIYLIPDVALQIKTGATTYTTISANSYYTIPISRFNEEGYVGITAKTSTTGITNIGISTSTTAESNTFICKIIDSSLTTPRFSIIELDEEELDRLGNGYNYIVDSQLNIVCDIENQYAFEDYYRNFRLGVVNSIAATNDKTEIFEACKDWSSGLSSFNTYIDQSLEFTYDEDYPVYIIVTGDYPVTEYFTCNFTLPTLTEATKYEGYDTKTIVPTPINSLLTDGEVSQFNLPVYQTSSEVIFHNLPFDDDFGTNDDYAIRGVEVTLELETDSQVIISANIKSPTGLIGSKSGIFNSGNEEIVFGGKYDLWGLDIQDMEDLQNFEVEFTFSNLTGEAGDVAQISISNVNICVYYLIMDATTTEEVWIDGENLKWYNVFIQNLKLPFGLNTDTKYVNVDGTDLNEPSKMNIDTATIELEFTVDGCDITETTEMMKQVTKLLTNRRDNLDRPILKTFETSVLPGELYEYLLEDGIDGKVNIADYECKAKFSVPAGTSFMKENTVTANTGAVDSIARVSPYIILVALGDTIELVEENSEQKFSLSYEDAANKIIEIDCEDRVVWIRDDEESEPVNITGSVDFNSSWFSLDGVYSFVPTNCVLQSVTYTERA